MASGFGWTGGRSKCFTHWQEFQKCYAQADSPTECVDKREDYVECLHQRKAIARATAIQAEYARQLGDKKANPVGETGGITDVSLLKPTQNEEAKGH